MVSYLRRIYLSVWNVLLKSSLDNVLNFTAVFHSHIETRERSRYPLNRKLGGLQNRSWRFGEEKNSRVCRNSNHGPSRGLRPFTHILWVFAWVKECLFFFVTSLTDTNCAWQNAHGILSLSIQENKNLYLLLTMPSKGTSFSDPVKICWNLKNICIISL